MTFLPPLLLAACGAPLAGPEAVDPAQLREVLYDQQNAREQSQAALLLVRQRSAAAEEIVRRGLRQTASPDVFLALAAALRLAPDARFTDELLAALCTGAPGQPPAVRQAVAESLAVLADARVVERLRKLLDEARGDAGVRQTALWVLGRCGRKEAAEILVGQLDSRDEVVQRAASEALAELTGLAAGAGELGERVARWRAWWEANRGLPPERWLEQRLAYQGSRARRLDGELERTRAEVVRLHQQLYNRLPVADRLGHVQAAAEHEAAAVRALAVNWVIELLAAPGAGDGTGRAVGEVLLRLSHDSSPEVQRLAVLALGRIADEAAFDRLRSLLREGRAPVRAAAARALAQQARGGRNRLEQVVPLLQKALGDPALEVVVEAAEDLGALGVPEAGPVLVCLLRHPSDSVRQAAGQALERVAGAAVLASLLDGLDDPAVAVRFGLVGAVGRVAGAEGKDALSASQREAVLARLQTVLHRDADPGVRSRAATVLGECGPPSVLPALWQRVAAVEDARVQQKAWMAFIDIIVRSGSLDLLREWDAELAKVKPKGHEGGDRRLRLLAEAHERWQKREDRRLFAATAELLASAQLDQGKWPAAVPLLRDLLARGQPEGPSRERALRLLLAAAQQARRYDLAAVRWIAEKARPYLTEGSELAEEFQKVEAESQESAIKKSGGDR